MYLTGFVADVMLSDNRAKNEHIPRWPAYVLPDGSNSRMSHDITTLCLVKLVRWRHWGWSLSSLTAYC